VSIPDATLGPLYALLLNRTQARPAPRRESFLRRAVTLHASPSPGVARLGPSLLHAFRVQLVRAFRPTLSLRRLRRSRRQRPAALAGRFTSATRQLPRQGSDRRRFPDDGEGFRRSSHSDATHKHYSSDEHQHGPAQSGNHKLNRV
jgi:hypothetical protein